MENSTKEIVKYKAPKYICSECSKTMISMIGAMHDVPPHTLFARFECECCKNIKTIHQPIN